MIMVRIRGAMARLALAMLMAALALGNGEARAGVGVTRLAIFEPRPSADVPAGTAEAVARAFHGEFLRLMDEHEIWGIETVSLEDATSAARNLAGIPAPAWTGEYTPQWIDLLNSSRMITYAAVGEVGPADGGSGGLRARYDLRDFILNASIAGLTATGSSPEEVGRQLGSQALAALQLYLAEITEVGQGKALINVGLEALSTGTLLTALAHGHLGPHPPDYPPHGHREEDDHLLGSAVYLPYRGTVATSATIHSHSRSRWRALQRNFPPALENLATTAPETAAAVPVPAPVVGIGMPQMTNPYDFATTPTVEEQDLLRKAHQHSGRPTGVLRVTGFVKPHRYFNTYYAVAEVVEGFAVPGAFLRRREE